MTIMAAILEHGSFSGAAKALDLTPSAISKAVTRLEQRLGVRLLERTTRRLIPTPEGISYTEAARRILNDIDEAEAAVVEERGHPRGRLKINVSTAFLAHHLAGALPDFLALYPNVHVDLSVSDHIIDVVAEGMDVAIRTGTVADERLGLRKFGDLRRIICASAAYLARHGVPRTPSELAHHACISVASRPYLSLWPFHVEGRIEVIETHGPVSADSAEGVLALGLSGLGLVRLADIVVSDAIKDGRLIPVLMDAHHAEPLPISLVFPPLKQRIPRVRVFIDFIVNRFKASPWRIAT